jgi:hypothetical protein
MKYRTTELLAETDVESAGTKTIDINLSDVISRIQVKFATRNPAGALTITETEVANLPKVELVDGSDVLYSLTGMEGQAMDFFDTLKPNQSNGSFVSSWDLVCMVNLNFGRYLLDPDLAFDPKRFHNPQLKIQHSEAAAVTSTVVNKLTVLADVFDEKAVSPMGFLMNKELKSYSGVASAWEETDLPTDFPHRKLMIQARQANLWLGAILNHIKLTEDNDKKIPLDMDIKHLERWLESIWPPYWQHMVADLDQTTGDTLYTIPTQTLVVPGTYAVSGVLDAVPFGYTQVYKSTAEAVNVGFESFSVSGYLPHGCLCIPFGLQDDPDDWYDAGGKSLILKIQAGTLQSGSINIVNQQLRKY